MNGALKGQYQEAININCFIDDCMVIITCKEKNGIGEE